MNQRLITFGGSTVGIEYGSGRSTDMVNFLFQHIPSTKSGQPWTWLRLEDRADVGELWLWQDDKLFCKAASAALMANQLMSQVCFVLAYTSRPGLLLHAAAVQCSGQGILLPGKSGSGKSSLTAWLLGQGGRYLSDEMVYVAGESNAISGFARPITIKKRGRHLLPEHLRKAGSSNGIARSDPADMIAPEQFGAEVLLGDSPVDLIIFPRYQQDQACELNRLSQAQAAFELLACLANARNLDHHGIPGVKGLAKSAPAYSLAYSAFEQVGQAVKTLLRP